jgi:gliding motility-associated-like protein
MQSTDVLPAKMNVYGFKRPNYKINKFKPFLFCYLVALLITISSHAQESYCNNLGFELGNFTNWVGYTWIYSEARPAINTSKVAGIVNRRQTIISDTTAYDANTDYKLKMVPKGYNFSARLGDAITSSDVSPRCWEQSLRYTMTIDSSNALLIMKFACVLQYASDHNTSNEPRFRLMLYDAKGNVITDCSNYDVFASSSYVKGFNTYTPSTSTTPGGKISPVKWRDWTTVGANLLKYYGQTITVEFLTADCSQNFHYGYAYFVASCHPLYITVKYCAKDTIASLTAPEGFEKYIWTDKSGKSVDTLQILKVLKPVGGESFSCTMTSATGCVVTLQSTIAKYVPLSDFSSYMIDCKSNTVQFTNLSSTTRGTLQYKWDFGDTTTSTQTNPRHTFATSGLHSIKLILKNPPSTCTDTLKKVVESFSPPLVGIKGDSTYCPNLSIYLRAYGAYYYTWSNGLKTDSIEVMAPGGTFWMVGHSSTGCISDTMYKTVYEEPDWKFLAVSDTTLCEGLSTVLSVSGAYHYLWSTKDTVNSITAKSPGKYSVTGTNKRGCAKYKTFNVTEYPIPKIDFNLSTSTLDNKHNNLTCNIPAETGVNYFWDMGDGTADSGSTIQHTYNITNEMLLYKICVKATSIYDCSDSAYRIVDVVPFVPNIFSPNGDGINDLFMVGLDLQVFDRNGLVVYQGNTGWDGKYKGQFLDPDTYFYLIRYPNRDQKIQSRKGYITLVR